LEILQPIVKPAKTRESRETGGKENDRENKSNNVIL